MDKQISTYSWHMISRRLFFIYRNLTHNKLDGTIPVEISTLVKLTGLCVLASFFDKCWPLIIKVAQRLNLIQNPSSGIYTALTSKALFQFRSQPWLISVHCGLLKISLLFTQCRSMSFRIFFSEWWQEHRSPHTFDVNLLLFQVLKYNPDHWHNTRSNLNLGEADRTVRPHFFSHFLMSAGRLILAFWFSMSVGHWAPGIYWAPHQIYSRLFS